MPHYWMVNGNFSKCKWLINGSFSGFHRVALSSTVSRSNWNLGILVYLEEGKTEYLEKNPRSKDENQQQTKPHMVSTPGIEPGKHR